MVVANSKTSELSRAIGCVNRENLNADSVMSIFSPFSRRLVVPRITNRTSTSSLGEVAYRVPATEDFLFSQRS